MAHMVLSDSKVKTCSKTCLKNHETLKTQYDKLRIEHNKTEFDLANYKRALASVEEQLAFYKQNEGLGYNVVPPPPTGLFAPPTIDLSYSGIEKFKEPEFKDYGVRIDKNVSENSLTKIKKTIDDPIIEDWVSNDEEHDLSKPKSEKKQFILTGNLETELEDLVRLNSPEDKKVTRARKTCYKAAVKLHDQFNDEKRAGAELTQQNDSHSTRSNEVFDYIDKAFIQKLKDSEDEYQV
ncbi:hypothetical protein Tco_1190311 [Tanacetum coccineum]